MKQPIYFFRRLAEADKVLFAKRLHFLLKAGVPILESLEILAEQASGKNHKIIFGHLARQVAGGGFLSAAMEAYVKEFGSFSVHIVKIGEESGVLAENLKYLADQIKNAYELKKKIQNAAFYPGFIFLATLAMVSVLVMVVFPKVLPIFKAINIPLPLTTRALIFTTDFLSRFWFYCILSFITAALCAAWLYKDSRIKISAQKFFLRLPVAGKLFQHYQLAKFCRTMGTLLKSHVPVDAALRIAKNATENLAYRRLIESILSVVLEGGTISSAAKKHQDLFPILAAQMVEVGERSGHLNETFFYLAEMYEQDIDEAAKNLSSLLEPLLMVLMGLLVGFVAISIIAPIYSVTQKLTK